MKIKNTFWAIAILFSLSCFSQRFNIGEQLTPSDSEFELIGKSSKTYVAAYKYIGTITERYYFNRRISTIIVGVKNGIIVTTIYNLIPEKNDIGVPNSTYKLVQKNLPFPLAIRDGLYGANIDDITITLSRANNAMTFNKDRIMFMKSVRNSILTR